MKVPHAVALHGIQVLPALAWLMSFTGFGQRARKRTVTVAVAGYAGLVAVAALQTFSGLAPLDLTIWAAVLLLASLTLLAGAAITGASGLRRSPSAGHALPASQA